MGDLLDSDVAVFALLSAATPVVLWRGVVGTWRGDRRSLYIRHRDPPPWFLFGPAVSRAMARGVVPAGMPYVLVRAMSLAALRLSDAETRTVARWVLLPLLVIDILAFAAFGVFSWPNRLVPPPLREPER